MPDGAAARIWTETLVEAELRLAMWTLKRLPSRNLFPAGFKAAWVAIPSDPRESYGYHAARAPRVTPSADEISRMDRALSWVWAHLAEARVEAAGLPPDTNAVVLMRCGGLAYQRIVQHRLERWMVGSHASGRLIPGGNSIPSVRKAFRGGLALIVAAEGGERDALPSAESTPPMEDAVEGFAVPDEARVVMVDDGDGLRPIARTLHYRARWVTRPKRR